MGFIRKFLEKTDLTQLLSAALVFLLLLGGLILARRVLTGRLERRLSIPHTGIDLLILNWTKITRTYFIGTLALYAAMLVLPLSDKTDAAARKVVILVGLVQLLQWAMVGIDYWIQNSLKKRADQDVGSATTLGLISFAARACVYMIVLLLALNNLGVNITALVAGLGVGGIAVALALQNILGDLFASLTIVLDKPFVVGDFIVVGDFLGTIEHIGLKTTRLRSLSGEQLIFSNGDLLQSRIRNFKRMAERRVVLQLTVTYQTTEENLRKIPQIARQIVEKQNGKKQTVRFDRCHFLEFQDSALRYELVYWVLQPDFNFYADIAQEVNVGLLTEFSKNGIEFAYPTRTLFHQPISLAPTGAPSPKEL